MQKRVSRVIYKHPLLPCLVSLEVTDCEIPRHAAKDLSSCVPTMSLSAHLQMDSSTHLYDPTYLFYPLSAFYSEQIHHIMCYMV